jgi:malate dehydrogenase
MAFSKTIKISVTGAAGNIAYAFLFRLASGAVFGADVGIHLHLMERPEILMSLNGLEMELNDCCFPNLLSITLTADLAAGMHQVDWAILIGAKPRRPGMERADLLFGNAPIFVEQGRAIDHHANENVKVLVVGNPCNTNASVLTEQCKRINRRSIFAMTMLDELRARYLLADKVGCGVKDIEGVIIFGNHSPSQCLDPSWVTVKGKPLTDLIKLDWFENEFLPTLQHRGASVIAARGASSAASAAHGIVQTIRCIEGLEGDQPFSLGILSEGEYDSPKELVVSLPCFVKDGQVLVDTSRSWSKMMHDHGQKTYQELAFEYQLLT